MGMNMATIATGAVCGVVARTAASLVALSGNLCSDKEARRHQRRRGARPERHRRRSNPARGRRRTPAHHARSGRGTQHTQNLVGSARAASLGFNAHVANVVAAMFLATGRDRGAGRRGRERHHDRRGAGRRPLRLGLHRLPRSRHRRRRHETPTQSEGPRYPRRQRRRRRPAGSNADALARCIAVGSLAGELSLLSALASRGTSPAPTPNSVGNCMGVVVRPRFIGSEFVDPTLIMNVLSREIPRDYEIPRYNAYHEHITKG